MNLVWFRNDLRVRDNPALYRACDEAGSAGVVAVAVICPPQWQLQGESWRRVQFWLQNLWLLQRDLQTLGIPLKLIYCDLFSELPQRISQLSVELSIRTLYFNREYPEYELRRDREVTTALLGAGVRVRGFDGDLILAPGRVLNAQGQPFRVFTPFSRRWRQQILQSSADPLPIPQKPAAAKQAGDHLPRNILYPGSAFQPAIELRSEPPSVQQPRPVQVSQSAQEPRPAQEPQPAQESQRAQKPQPAQEFLLQHESESEREADAAMPDHWPAGSEAAHRRLQTFVAEGWSGYGERRDFPALNGTSLLSPWLTVGALSARQCLAALQQTRTPEWLESPWVNEIIWREFYRHLLAQFPGISRWQPFRPGVEAKISWGHDDALFGAWCRGETGFPLVDAGMKQLLQTGWMHNRLRMITASFLTKLLRQDWRRGAQFFMHHLIDGDFASNVGGWQWSASVGADAAPYFRIFNPLRQSLRFDPQGRYIARWLPELAGIPGPGRCDPQQAAQAGRPAPIIDYTCARRDSLADYNSG